MDPFGGWYSRGRIARNDRTGNPGNAVGPCRPVPLVGANLQPKAAILTPGPERRLGRLKEHE